MLARLIDAVLVEINVADCIYLKSIRILIKMLFFIDRILIMTDTNKHIMIMLFINV
jgi:hypothetical protein